MKRINVDIGALIAGVIVGWGAVIGATGLAPTSATWGSIGCPAGVATLTVTATPMSNSAPAQEAIAVGLSFPREIVSISFPNLPQGQWLLQPILRYTDSRVEYGTLQTVDGLGDPLPTQAAIWITSPLQDARVRDSVSVVLTIPESLRGQSGPLLLRLKNSSDAIYAEQSYPIAVGDATVTLPFNLSNVVDGEYRLEPTYLSAFGGFVRVRVDTTVSTPPPPSPQESPNRTKATTITTNTGDVWTIDGNITKKNGQEYHQGRGSLYLYLNKGVYVLGTDSAWYVADAMIGWVRLGMEDPSVQPTPCAQVARGIDAAGNLFNVSSGNWIWMISSDGTSNYAFPGGGSTPGANGDYLIFYNGFAYVHDARDGKYYKLTGRSQAVEETPCQTPPPSTPPQTPTVDLKSVLDAIASQTLVQGAQHQATTTALAQQSTLSRSIETLLKEAIAKLNPSPPPTCSIEKRGEQTPYADGRLRWTVAVPRECFPSTTTFPNGFRFDAIKK